MVPCKPWADPYLADWRAIRGGLVVLFSWTPGPPPTLHMSQESRSESLRLYTQAFPSRNRSRFIWVSFGLDKIQIPVSLSWEFEAQDRVRIRRLAVEVHHRDAFDMSYGGFEPLEDMKSIKELDVLSKPPLWVWGYHLGDLPEAFEVFFGHLDGWTCPTIRIVHVESGDELNKDNYLTKVLELQDRAGARDSGSEEEGDY